MKTFLLTLGLGILLSASVNAATYSKSITASGTSVVTNSITTTPVIVYVAPTDPNFLYAVAVIESASMAVGPQTLTTTVINLGSALSVSSYGTTLPTRGLVAFLASGTVTAGGGQRWLADSQGRDNLVSTTTAGSFYTWGGLRVYPNERLEYSTSGSTAATITNIIEYYGNKQ